MLDNVGRSLGLDGLIPRMSTGPFVGDGRLARLNRKIA
jgi:hypothetical protein